MYVDTNALGPETRMRRTVWSLRARASAAISCLHCTAHTTLLDGNESVDHAWDDVDVLRGSCEDAALLESFDVGCAA